MTPHTDKGRGSFIIDRRFRGVGRIHRASGTSHKPTFRRIVQMLDSLYEVGRLDILKAVRDGKLAPLVVLNAWTSNALDSLPTAATMVPLLATYDSWTDTHECSDKHRASLKESGKHLKRHAVESTPLAELPAILAAVRLTLRDEGKAQTFRLVRAASQAFVRATLGRSHVLWRDVSSVDPLKVSPKMTPRPQSVQQLDALASRLGADLSVCLWSMATTGMGPKEYWGRWSRLPDRIHVYGTKRAGRDRDIPDIGIAVEPPITRAAFANRIARRKIGIGAYDLRRTFAVWMEAAGIPRTRRRIYMGHGTSDITSLYERHEVAGFLKEDAAKLDAYITANRAVQSKPTLKVSDGGAA